MDERRLAQRRRAFPVQRQHGRN